MSLFQSSLGIDLRKDRIILSHLRKSFNQISVTTSQIFPLSGDKGKEEREAEIINAIQRFISTQGLLKENVVLGLPREHLLMKIVEMPSAAKENLRRVLEYELGKHIPFTAEEALFDYQILDERDGMLEVLLLVTKRSDVQAYLDLFKRMGISPVIIEVSSSAVDNLFGFDQHLGNQGSFGLVQVEKEFFEIHLFEKGVLQEAVHRSFNMVEDRARELAEAYRFATLKGFGPAGDKRNLFVLGGESNEILVEKLKRNLGPDITLIRSFKRVRMTQGVEIIPECYASVGLALRGLVKTKWNINLLPIDLQKKVSRIGTPLAISLACVSVILMGATALHPWLQEREQLRWVQAEIKEKKPGVEEVEAIKKKKELLEKEVREFETLKREEVSKLELLRELSELLPPTVWVWNLKLRAKEIEINGFAQSASDLIAIIDKSALFMDTKFSSPVTKDRRPSADQMERERFRISSRIEGMK